MIVALIQARMRSTRLPGKVMLPISGQPTLWHIWWRMSQAKAVDKVVVTTSVDPSNQPIVSFCAENDIPCFQGSEEDVLDRVYRAAVQHKADAVVEITGDSPLIDPRVADRVVGEYLQYNPDFCSTSHSFTYPDGFDVAVLSMEALKQAHAEAEAGIEREHLTVFVRRRADRYILRFVENPDYHPFTDLCLSVDDQDDFDLITRIYEHLLPRKHLFHLEDVIETLSENPEWLADRPARLINEGYFKDFFTEAERPSAPPRNITLTSSQDLLKRAQKRIPSSTQTFSKGYTQFVQGVSPVFVNRGEGGLVYDVDGNDFIDYPLALGAITLGHSYPDVDEAVIQQVRKGASHSLPHRLEVELAERLCEVFPCAEMVRYGKNGSDATSGAVRVARAITGREKIACSGYHGWQDWYIGTTLRNRGVPVSTQELTLPFTYGDLEALERLFDENPGEIAAVIMEPVGTMVPPDGYLQQVKGLVRGRGALLIFDEIVTGFRLAIGGAQDYFGVVPDMACIGKGMGNGYPISAVVGPRGIMEEFDRSFFSFTFAGEAVSLAATMATIDVFERENVTSHMWILGRKLKDGYNYLARRYGLDAFTWCQGLPAYSGLTFNDAQGVESLLHKSIFQQECIKRGVLWVGLHKFCLMHTQEQIEYTLAVYDEAFRVLKKAYESDDPEVFLEGPMLEPVFRQQNY